MRKKAGVTPKATRTRAVRRNYSRAITWRVASCARSRKGGGLRMAASISISPGSKKTPERGRTHQTQAAEHVSPVQTARRHRHHRGADGSRADDALRHGWSARGRRHPDVARAGLFAAGECAAGINGANRLGGIRSPILLVFGKRAGEFAAKFAQGKSLGEIDNEPRSRVGAREALAAI